MTPSRSSIVWAATGLVVSAACTGLTQLDGPVGLRLPMAMLFAGFVPGAAVIGPAVVRDLPLRLVTAIATSIAIVTVTTHAMVLLGWWQPARIQLVLAAGSAVLFVWQLSRARAAGATGLGGVEVQASR